MLKNRYYKIILNSKKEIIIRVKKDFYTEGIIINENKLLQGYFDFYYSIYLNINICLTKLHHSLRGKCLSTKKSILPFQKTIFSEKSVENPLFSCKLGIYQL